MSLIDRLFLFLGITLVFIFIVGTVFLYLQQQDPSDLQIRLPDNEANYFNQKLIAKNQKEGQYVASINGSFYYPPNCAATNRIKDMYKIWFFDDEEARQAGYQIKTCSK